MWRPSVLSLSEDLDQDWATGGWAGKKGYRKRENTWNNSVSVVGWPQLVTKHPHCCSLPLPVMRKLTCQHRDSLIGEGKRQGKQTNKNWGKVVMNCLGASKVMPFLSSHSPSQAFLSVSYDIMVHKISLQPIWVSCPNCVTPILLAHLLFLRENNNNNNKRKAWLCGSTAIVQILMCYQHCFSHKSKT